MSDIPMLLFGFLLASLAGYHTNKKRYGYAVTYSLVSVCSFIGAWS